MYAELKERCRAFMAGIGSRVNGISCTQRTVPTSLTLQQPEKERQVHEQYLRNKYGLPEMMASEGDAA